MIYVRLQAPALLNPFPNVEAHGAPQEEVEHRFTT
jgi:hypothetical protein